MESASTINLSGYGYGVTGSFVSGRHFGYRFEPINGYLTGDISPTFVSEFTQNAIAGNVEQSQANFDSAISSIQSNTFSTSLAIPSGIYETGILYSEIGNDIPYSNIPQVFITMESDENIPFMYFTSTTKISKTGFFVDFSDKISETGHSLKIVIQKDS